MLFCSMCGKQLTNEMAFCPNCGSKAKTPSNDTPSNKRIHLKCIDCGGTLSVERDRSILICPYCGKKDLIVENDNVTIQRIKSNTYRDIKVSEQQMNKEIEVEKIKAKLKSKQDNRDTFEGVIMLIVGIFILLLGLYLLKK